MATQKLKADKRQLFGRKLRALRKTGIIPANLFGKNIKSQAISIEEEAFRNIYKLAGETSIINLEIGKLPKPVLISNVQTHPVSSNILHVDFRQVDLKEKINAQIPLELVGESPAERSNLGTVVQQLNELEIEALPGDLPDNFEIDITVLKDVDDAIYVKDINYDKKKIKIVDDEQLIIVKVEPPQKEEVIEAPPVQELPEEEPAAQEEATEETSQPEEKQA